VLNAAEKVCLVTGATAGIGRVIARLLAESGATVLVHGRNEVKGRDIVQSIIAETSNDKVKFVKADLANLSDVQRLATKLNEDLPRLDVIINNAMHASVNREVSSDGYEKTFAVNHLAHFFLNGLLMNKLRAARGRIVVVSSDAHRSAKFDFENIMLTKKYGFTRAYAQSKLANVWYTREFAKRLSGDGVSINALSPGSVRTYDEKKLPLSLSLIMAVLGPIINVSAEEGAATPVYLALSPEVVGLSGEYFKKCKVASVSKLGADDACAKKLWDMCIDILKGYDPDFVGKLSA
tara:strand:- start:682 stop:1560 length:879 start_codon:yes stop_codon:yes gene_type:complete